MKPWRTFTHNRTTKRMTRKLRRHGLRFFVIGYFGEYWLYQPHPRYEWCGHQPIQNLGPRKRPAWDALNAFIEQPTRFAGKWYNYVEDTPITEEEAQR